MIFFNRLWDSEDNNLSPGIHPVKAKVKKPQSKGAKAASVEKVTVDRLITRPDHTTFIPEQQPYHSLLQIYKKQFLDASVSKGLINSDSLSVAGNGTPIVTSHRTRSNRICCCHKNGISKCSCDRYFSQPDCDIGWDSSRDCWYHGYDLYMLVASESESDLPVFPLLNPASKHDSHGFLETFFRMKSFLPDFIVTKLLLDSAHDAIPIYEYCKQENITPFIDLNEKRGIKVKYKNDFTIGKDGVPANIPALIQNMAEQCILLGRTIQD